MADQRADRRIELADRAPAGLGVATAQLTLLWINDYLGEQLGLSPGNQDGRRSLMDHLSPASRIFAQVRLLQELSRGGWVEELALDLIDDDGGRTAVMISARPLEGEGDGEVALVISRAPVRRAYEAQVPLARQAAEAEREAARNVIAAFVRSCPIPLVMTDRQLIVTGVSQAWEKAYGRSAGQVIGQSMEPEAAAGKGGPSPWADIYARALDGETVAGDAPTRSAHVDFWFEWSVIPWRDARGEVGGLLLLNFDVSNLVRAREAAEAADAAKSRFLANLSHELRTPLNGVLAPLELLQDMGLTPEARAQVGRVRSKGGELARNLTTLLDYSQLETGEFEPQEGPVELRRLCAALLDEHRDLLGDRPIRLQGPSGGKAMEIMADEDALRRILSQLLSNAIKFTDEGAVNLSWAAQGEMLTFEVADTGCGFDPASFADLTKPFYQRDGSTTRRHGGMGLGLALAERLATGLGGRLSARQGAGRGSVVALTIPLKPARRSGPVLAPPVAPEGPMRVLAVDDNPANLALLQALLPLLGAEVATAVNGLDAVQKTRLEAFDLILMDVQMPVMDGLAAIRMIRSEEPRRTPVIVISANVSRPEVAAARLAGADLVLGKPVTPAALAAAVNSVFSVDADA
ncbi:MAG: response regulator [Caulobacteraceae bacterium]|nr:MAG: response regulator [Caulobacteraceae bacterium]